MVAYAHKQITEAIAGIDRVPDDRATYNDWILAPRHLDFLQTNATKNELIIYAGGPYSFVHSVAVPAEALAREGVESLLAWNDGPFHSIASYVSGGGRETMWIERGKHHCGAAALEAGVDLIFARTFDGWSDPDRAYFEANQEYTHLAAIHWRPEKSANCRFDDAGDLEEVVSITLRKNRDDVALATFTWPGLEEYLSIAGYVLVRMFDFTLLRHDHFSGWDDSPEKIVTVSNDFLYKQKDQSGAAYTRGVQIIRPRDAREISEQVSSRWGGRNRNREYVTFIAEDWHKKIAEMSTDPVATTNYFQAKENDLPFELSPAFFKPEVLSKYKTDRDKYTVDEREIHCRAAWTLKAYDVNDADQVFAYIC